MYCSREIVLIRLDTVTGVKEIPDDWKELTALEQVNLRRNALTCMKMVYCRSVNLFVCTCLPVHSS